MIVAVSSTGPSLDAQIDPHFGRCPYLVFVETDDMSFEALDNANIARDSGAGTQTAQTVATKGAQAVLTGHCGGNAKQALDAARIEIVSVDENGSVAEAVMRFRGGRPIASRVQAPRARDAIADE